MQSRTPPRRLATRAEAAALGSAVRLRIIRLTYHRALTNKELAERLEKDPATTLHHVRKLVDTGFLAALPPRRGTRGSREIPYRSTGLSWRLDPGSPRDAAVNEAMLEAFLGELGASGVERLEQSRLILQLGDREQREFVDRLHALLDEFAAREPDLAAARRAVYVANYPCE